MFIAPRFTITKMQKQPKCPPMDKWINKVWYIHTRGSHSAFKRNDICHMLQDG